MAINWRAVLRRSGIAAGVLLVFLLVAVAATQTPFFRDWVRTVVIRQAGHVLDAELSIARLGGSLWGSAEAYQVSLHRGAEPLAEIERLSIDYSLWDLVTRGIIIDRIVMERPVIHLRQMEDGRWNLASILRERETPADRQSSAAFTLADLQIVDGVLYIDPRSGADREVHDLDVVMGLRTAGEGFDVDVRSANARIPSLFAITRFVGRVRTEGETLRVENVELDTERSRLRVGGEAAEWRTAPRLDLHVRAEPLSLPEIAPLVTAIERSSWEPRVDVTLRGPMDALVVNGSVGDGDSRASADVTIDATAKAPRVAGRLTFANVDAAEILGDPKQRTRLTGRGDVDLVLDGGIPSGTFAVEATDLLALGFTADALRARGTLEGDRLAVNASIERAGARATTEGTIANLDTPAALQFDLRGTFRDVDLRALPAEAGAPQLASRLAGKYQARGRSPLDVQVVLAPSTLEGARIADGTVAEVSQRPGRVTLRVEGAVEQLDPAHLGRRLRIAALADPRLAGVLNGPVRVEAAGPTFGRLEGRAAGTLLDSTIGSAHMGEMAYDVAFSPAEVNATLRGDVSSLNPRELGVEAVKDTELSGTVDVRVGYALKGAPASALDRLRAGGTVTLGPSRVEGLRVEALHFTGEYEPRRVRIDKLSATGPDVTLDANGTLVLSGEGETALEYRVDVPDLSVLSARAGQPLAGTAHAEGRATGANGDLTVEGTFTAADVGVGATTALGAGGTFTVELPQMDTRRLGARLDAKASYLRAGGQEIPALAVNGTYANRAADFTADATVGHRQVRVGGHFAMDPVQTLQVRELNVRAGDAEWNLAADSTPTLRRLPDAIEVDGLTLVRGAQRLAVTARLPLEGGSVSMDRPATIRVTADQLELGDVYALARPPQAVTPAGRISGQLSLDGPLRAPTGSAEVLLVEGRVRPQVALERVDARAQIAGGAITVDADVVQSAGAALTVDGQVPWALVMAAGNAEARNRQPIDVTVKAAGVQLALLETLTDQVTGVSGTFNGEVHARGTLGQPAIDGDLTLAGGALQVTATGATYNGIEGRLDFTSDRVDIRTLRVLDENGDPLTVSGQVALTGFRVSGVEATITAQRFEVLDNEFGELEVHATLRVGGSLTAPRLSGQVAVQTGRLEADELLAEFGRRRQRRPAPAAPATPATSAPAAGAAPAPSATPAAPAPQEAASEGVTLDVRLTVPDNLVIRGRDLRQRRGAQALGNVNVTIGGELEITGTTADQGPSVVGSLRAVRGFYAFQGRRFEVERGSEVRFGGFVPIDPALNVTAHREISGIDTRVHVRGTVSQPELTLSSTPPLDQSDILSLIVFNQPANTLGAAERTNLAERAATLAAGAITGPLAESVAAALDLDYVELRAATENGGGPSVNVGEQIGDRAFIGYEQHFGAGDFGRLTFEYRLTDFLRLVTTFATGSPNQVPGLSRRIEEQTIDLFFVWTY